MLFLAYYAPPVQVTGNIRRFHLLQEFQKHFSDVYIITSSNADRMRQDDSLQIPNFPVYKVNTFDLRTILLRKKQENAPTVSTAIKSNYVFRSFRRITDSFPFNLILDDGGVSYIWSAYQEAIQLIEKHNISYIFSSFRPFADHMIAYLLVRRFPEIIWIADFRDLPIDPVRKNTICSNWQWKWKAYYLQKAAILTTVSEGLAKRFRTCNSNIYVLPNAVPNPIPQPSYLNDKTFIITYTGSLYPELQDLALFLSSVKLILQKEVLQSNQLRLVYAGKDANIWNKHIRDYQLEAVSRSMGVVLYREARIMQMESHINLLLSWSSKKANGIMTAKRASYLAANRPILAIIKGEKDDEFEQQWSDLQAGTIIYTSTPKAVEVLVDFLEEKIQIWKHTGELPSQQNKENLTALQWDEEVRRFIRKLD